MLKSQTDAKIPNQLFAYNQLIFHCFKLKSKKKQKKQTRETLVCFFKINIEHTFHIPHALNSPKKLKSTKKRNEVLATFHKANFKEITEKIYTHVLNSPKKLKSTKKRNKTKYW